MLNEKWTVTDNLVFKGTDINRIIAECESHEVASKIAKAHNKEIINKEMIKQQAADHLAFCQNQE